MNPEQLRAIALEKAEEVYGAPVAPHAADEFCDFATRFLAAMKKKIDGNEKSKFKQFTALKDGGNYPGRERYTKVLIVGVKRARANTFRGSDFWTTSTGEHLSTVYADTTESLAALRARDKLIEKQRAEKEAMDKAHAADRKAAAGALHVVPL